MIENVLFHLSTLIVRILKHFLSLFSMLKCAEIHWSLHDAWRDGGDWDHVFFFHQVTNTLVTSHSPRHTQPLLYYYLTMFRRPPPSAQQQQQQQYHGHVTEDGEAVFADQAPHTTITGQASASNVARSSSTADVLLDDEMPAPRVRDYQPDESAYGSDEQKNYADEETPYT
jgi:hypothetical protein